MATMANILSYISSNRLSTDENRYLTQDENGNDARGRDAVFSSLRSHLHPMFRKQGSEDMYNEFKDALDELSSGAMTDSETITAAFKILDTSDDTSKYQDWGDIFEAMINFSLYEMYSFNSQAMDADDKKKIATDIIMALIGDNARPSSEGGGSDGATGSNPVYFDVAIPTEEDEEDQSFGFEV